MSTSDNGGNGTSVAVVMDAERWRNVVKALRMQGSIGAKAVADDIEQLVGPEVER